MKIAVLSRNPNLYSTQSLVLAGRRKGHHMKVIDHLQCDLIMEQNKLRVFYEGYDVTKVDAIIPRVGSSATVYGASVIRQFELNNVFTTLKSGPLLLSRSKLSSLQLLAAAGIPVPKSLICTNAYALDSMAKYIGEYPMIMKMLNSTHGLGVLLANDPNQLQSLFETFSSLKQRMLMQEFIKEASGADIRVFVVNGQVIAAMKRQAKKGEFRSNLHRGATATIEELSLEERAVAIKATQVLDLSIAGVDLLRSDKGPLILEVNPSPGLEGIETTTRFDIAGYITDFIVETVLQNRKKHYER
ncbi:UNVERIFIED_CONTAM: hypothetical protein GTU68_050152 [Idotea baltica]|nr:hypothetical protein [Idotea baltica]